MVGREPTWLPARTRNGCTRPKLDGFPTRHRLRAEHERGTFIRAAANRSDGRIPRNHLRPGAPGQRSMSLDGEIVALDVHGRPSSRAAEAVSLAVGPCCILRLQAELAKARAKLPARLVSSTFLGTRRCHLRGAPIFGLGLRYLFKCLLPFNFHIQLIHLAANAEQLYAGRYRQRLRRHVAKRKNSPYQPKRSNAWPGEIRRPNREFVGGRLH